MADDSGLSAAVVSPPISSAHSVGTVRNSHAETPAARATISSDVRVNRQKHSNPPNSTANGRIWIMMKGTRSPAISPTKAKVASGLLAERRKSSMKSNMATRPDRAIHAAEIAVTKCLAM